jgi:plastocyanin
MSRTLTRVVALAALYGMLAPPAMAGVLKGRIAAPPMKAYTTPNPYGGHASALPVAAVQVPGLISDAVVYFEKIPAAAESVLAHQVSHPSLAQKDQCFVPRVLPITKGTTVDFPNFDPIYHNVFSVSPVKRFDLGKYPRGQSRKLTFPKTGVVNVFCDIHSNMVATILVLPHHAVTQPDAEGRFALPDVPGGRYVLKVWHPDRPTLTREVDVPEQGETAVLLEY